MKVLILGADGMIGHKIYQSLSNNGLDLIVSSRKEKDNLNIDFTDSSLFVFDIFKDNIEVFLKFYKPDFIINCIGITTRRFGNIDIDKIHYCKYYLYCKYR